MLTSSQVNHLLNNVIYNFSNEIYHFQSNTENQVRACACDNREFMRLVSYSPDGIYRAFTREETSQLLQARDRFVRNSSMSFRARVNQAVAARMIRTMCRG